MANSIIKIKSKLMRDYYKYFSKYAKGKKPEKKIAWITAFTPVEILEALDMSYYYPESYAAVIAASGQEQALLETSAKNGLSLDCCSYSCCFNSSIELGEGPRGIPPTPDILIATNNQCNTLPNWWNVLAARFKVPLLIIDYPGEYTEKTLAEAYVRKQHRKLITELEELTGNRLDEHRLYELVEKSKKSVEAWEKIIGFLPQKKVEATSLFDDINFLITARCKDETSELYTAMIEDLEESAPSENPQIPLYWLGYPLWYHSDRYFKEMLDKFRVVGSNYITWWNLDYSGRDVYEQLFSAYNYTFLNLRQESRDQKLRQSIDNSGATCAIVLHNKSCKCDFVSARNIELPQAEIEIDMIDRNFINENRAMDLIELLEETICFR